MLPLEITPRSRGRERESVDDAAKCLRAIERGRRAWHGTTRLPPSLAIAFTAASFTLEGLAVDRADVAAASRPIVRCDSHKSGRSDSPGTSKCLRSRSSARLRNHLAILQTITRRARDRKLQSADVLRWYTRVSSGLCTSAPSIKTMQRLEAVVDRVNTRRARLQPALTQIADLYCELMDQPIFPSFNGIVARLLLCAHLARAGLPPAVFDPLRDAQLLDPTQCATRLRTLLPLSFVQPTGNTVG